MKVALIAPLISASASPHLGGVQELIADLGHGLKQRGHQILLFARDDTFAPGIATETIAVSHHFSSRTPEERLQAFFLQVNLFLDLFLQLEERRSEFDLIHVHAQGWAALAYGSIGCTIPVVHTLHLPAAQPEANMALHVLHRHNHPVTLVAVSQACAQMYADYTPVDHVIYNGLDVQHIPFTSHISSEAPLLYAGRIVPEKGVEEAIEIAERAHRSLVIAGSIDNPTYYKERIVPRIQQADGRIRYVGLLKRSELWEVMGHSLGLLFPIKWEEPFGLSAIEAMATGTPVIAFRRGAVGEIIRDGKTGFLVDPGDCIAAASCVDTLHTLSRPDCREHIEANFSSERMLDAYEQLYQEKLASHPNKGEAPIYN